MTLLDLVRISYLAQQSLIENMTLFMSLLVTFLGNSFNSTPPAHVPAIQLTPHIQLIEVLSAVREQDDFTPALELSGHLHAQSERLQSEGDLGNHLHIAVAGLGGEHQAFNTANL